MSKQNVLKQVKDQVGDAATMDQIKSVAQSTFDTLQGLSEGDSCRIPNFGTFKVEKRAARKAHNPKTREEINIPARNVMKFKIAKNFKDELNVKPAGKKKAKKK